MAHCNNCNYKWKAKDIWQLGFTKKGKECPNCRTKQFATFKDKEVILGLGYLSWIFVILIIIFFPFVIKLSYKEEKFF
ncbi:hypothetical protein [Bacillus sp. AFS088145]|uniref:hypothetical protein n=1 Tax=Bacillus sp. AFS088145 TaxID=2033514 RepID=UPI000BF4E735|nr:hypothetical protein [Bacillus sp. AFS088145]PFH90726.1 hypothetical protein COI44_04365 [Bacillus sp. AFS088145]